MKKKWKYGIAIEHLNQVLLYGEVSAELRNIIALLTEWLANNHPPWVSYCTLMAGHLIGLDKQP